MASRRHAEHLPAADRQRGTGAIRTCRKIVYDVTGIRQPKAVSTNAGSVRTGHTTHAAVPARTKAPTPIVPVTIGEHTPRYTMDVDVKTCRGAT